MLRQHLGPMTSRQPLDGSQHRSALRQQDIFADRGGSEIRSPAPVARLVESEIIPRLASVRGREQSNQAVSAEAVSEFAMMSLSSDPTQAIVHFETMQAGGLSLETLYLKLLVPAARWLGELWAEDRLSFVEVTLGCWRMQQIVRSSSPTFLSEAPAHDTGRHALILSAPGEQHSFGIVILSEFFRRAGWSVSGGPGLRLEDVARTVRANSFSVVGFSVSSEHLIDTLATCIRQVRSESRNRSVGVLVGGRLFNDHPEFLARVDADATASDARHAVEVAERFPDTTKLSG